MAKLKLSELDTAHKQRFVIALAISVCAILAIVGYSIEASGGYTAAPGKLSNKPAVTKTTRSSATPSATQSDDPHTPQTDTGQPPLPMDAANRKLSDCVQESTSDKLDTPGQRAARDVLRRCFYSSGYKQGDIYALRSIGDVRAVATVYDPAYGDESESTARTETEFRLGDMPVATVTCFWDVQLMQCKLQRVAFTDDGLNLYNRGIRAQGQSLE